MLRPGTHSLADFGVGRGYDVDLRGRKKKYTIPTVITTLAQLIFSQKYQAKDLGKNSAFYSKVLYTDAAACECPDPAQPDVKGVAAAEMRADGTLAPGQGAGLSGASTGCGQSLSS